MKSQHRRGLTHQSIVASPPNVAVVLFGSLARGDQTRRSDTDLLLISDESEARHVSVGHLSMFIYPWPQLKEDAEQGDLFVCHIVREAKPLFDPASKLEELKTHFVLRSSYGREIRQAADLGWFLIKHGDEINPALMAKRIVWCVRTILIAHTAEAEEPVFAPLALAERSNSIVARDLILRRHSRGAGKAMRLKFRQFLLEETKVDPFYREANRSDFIERFEETSNKVALQTVLQAQKRKSIYL